MLAPETYSIQSYEPKPFRNKAAKRKELGISLYHNRIPNQEARPRALPTANRLRTTNRIRGAGNWVLYLFLFHLILSQSSLHAAVANEALEPIRIRDIAGNQIDLSTPSDIKANVFIFILHDCPIANQYQPAIRRLAKDFELQGVRFHLVHADPDTTEVQAQKHASEYQIELPIYLDPNHDLVRRFEATVTPEAIVLDKKNEKVYQGRINNLYFKLGRKRFRPTEHDLADVLKAVLENGPIKHSKTTAIGCYIPPLANQ